LVLLFADRRFDLGSHFCLPFPPKVGSSVKDLPTRNLSQRSRQDADFSQHLATASLILPIPQLMSPFPTFYGDELLGFRIMPGLFLTACLVPRKGLGFSPTPPNSGSFPRYFLFLGRPAYRWPFLPVPASASTFVGLVFR